MTATRRAIWRRATACVLASLALTATSITASTARAASGHDGFLGSSGTAGAAGPPVVAAELQPTSFLPGIDVSHYQGAIDWTQVAASGVRFVFAKATEGRTFIDPTYATNLAGATAAGLVVGAYHFARPDSTPNDAILEADHLVDVAQPGQGNLFPVLDVERTGGLSSTDLTNWILAWLGEVTARTGVRPIIYTSPKGWDARTADTTAVADAGYTVLWVAHWNVATPTVPANNWEGNGWRFWQYSDCGTVPGIAGCVDLDWYNGLVFDPVTIPNPDIVPPAATLTTPAGVADALTVSFSEAVRPVTPANVVLRAADTGADVPATLACDGRNGAAVDCSTGKVKTAVLQPEGPLVSGETYGAIVNPVGAAPQVADLAGNVAPTTEQDFATPTVAEQRSPAVQYAWRTVSNAKAFGRSYAVEHLAGASASFMFTGRSVTWFTITGPTQGKAAVSIDGRERGTFDQYASTFGYRVARPFHHLNPGEHTITVRVLGKKGSVSATDTQVAIDAFQAGGRAIWNPSLVASWRNVHVPGASGGSVTVSDLAGSSAAFAFRGTGVQWNTVLGPDQGRAKVYMDGALVKQVDDYAKKTAVATRTIGALAEGVHTLRIVVLGQARPAAAGVGVSIDGFTVVP